MLFLIWMKALEAELRARVRRVAMMRQPSWESFFAPIVFILIIKFLMVAEKRSMSACEQKGIADIAILGTHLKSCCDSLRVFFCS